MVSRYEDAATRSRDTVSAADAAAGGRRDAPPLSPRVGEWITWSERIRYEASVRDWTAEHDARLLARLAALEYSCARDKAVGDIDFALRSSAAYEAWWAHLHTGSWVEAAHPDFSYTFLLLLPTGRWVRARDSVYALSLAG